VQVPYWQEILTIASQSFELTGLGYLGVDIVLDKQIGPLMLELNARPGLNIQIANREGLDLRLQKIKQRMSRTGRESMQQRIDFSKQQF
jgi:glutathione synthase/RimK-type ligase-like ATP-grasp enzyme